MQKICKSCLVKKPISEFYKKRNSFESTCKSCKYKNAKKHELKCENCGKEFLSSKKTQRYCGASCRIDAARETVIKECANCGKEISRKKSEAKAKFSYCSIKCRNEHMKVRNIKKNNPNWKAKTITVQCDYCRKNFEYKNYTKRTHKYCSRECKSKHQSITLKSENNPNFKNKTIHTKCDCCKKEITVPEHKKKKRKNVYCSVKCKNEHNGTLYSGVNNPNYINGLSHDYRIRYRIVEGYNQWRKNVMQRDNFTCQLCGDSKGGNLHAHHLDGYNWAKAKRTEIDNGITLCSTCHTGFHKRYGNGNNTKQQFEKYKEEIKTLA